MLLCCAFMLFHGTSCESIVEVQNSDISQGAVNPSCRVAQFVQQVRMGQVEAYDSLALCYRDGIGVRKSGFNMMIMYIFSGKVKGSDIIDIIKAMDKDKSFPLLIDVLDHPRIEDVPQEAVAKLRSVSPADALLFDAVYALECENDTAKSERLFVEAATQGSDLAPVLQVIMYKHLKWQEKHEQSLRTYAEKYPVMYVKLGDICMQKNNEENWMKAVEYYNLADKCGMLTPRGARNLSIAYRLLEKAGKLKCDSKEMARLELLGNRVPSVKQEK